MHSYDTPWDLIRQEQPDRPIAVCRPHLVRQAAEWFLTHFSGDTLYAVKANPAPWVLKTLYSAAMRHFDVASTREMEAVAAYCPDAVMSFMHPVKSRPAIERAYKEFGIRTFAYDCEAELEKIFTATGNAKDLTLILRVAVSNQGAEMPIDGKFGATAFETPTLLRDARSRVERLGVSFHPGSQCMDPFAWSAHCELLSRLITEADVDIDIVDVGGGFPVSYPGKEPPALHRFTAAIREAFDRMPLPQHAELWCEPGRALVAEGGSILTEVHLVRGNSVYINDGAFGSLYDAAHCDWPYPTRLIRSSGTPSARLKAFKLFGPTCDSEDVIKGPIFLPEDIGEGDMIEIGMLGAYGVTMQTRFNGYGETLDVVSRDAPWGSVFDTRNELASLDWFSRFQ
ncbi:type III PLP-dependent enzyme [Ponticaulis sp.]|uniref:type III PLP-dependent enzyme n=1 Tax=Ponticaulis sp. TaxID=2020902 RepID=UPI000B729EBB|nr:type III PLP-dependent enzyme [Ponticaulis sp.]MAI89963.1 decarboxylase [Ponticaulis sp.]OUX99630.1 MAG: decarboxylase [Hyphomonadaceae bacterium TMED5]